jgi:hypothetical protein
MPPSRSLDTRPSLLRPRPRLRPGEASQVDFTEVVSLRVNVAGELFAHLLCVFTLPFSTGGVL